MPPLQAAVTLHGPRITLRPWVDSDLAPFAALNADPEVMRHFPAPLGTAESDAMAGRIRAHFAQHGWGLWALQAPGCSFAGFVGLATVPFTLPVPGYGEARAPHLEIGWRLARHAWGQGWASEGAALALDFALRVLRRPQVLSFTAHSNTRSAAVMQRIGLQLVAGFDHPRLAIGHPLRRHVLYASVGDGMDGTGAPGA